MGALAVACFVKTPGLSPVKTRLAKSIGEKKALEFYLDCIETTRRVLSRVDAVVHWAVAEADGMSDPRWENFRTIFQGPGELGDRLFHVYSNLLEKYGTVILMGADCPLLRERHLKEGAKALETHSFVVGPTLDGGYYLFGGKKPVPESLWTSVPYSESNTLDVFVDALNDLGSIARLETLFDVDTGEDLQKLEGLQCKS